MDEQIFNKYDMICAQTISYLYKIMKNQNEITINDFNWNDSVYRYIFHQIVLTNATYLHKPMRVRASFSLRRKINKIYGKMLGTKIKRAKKSDRPSWLSCTVLIFDLYPDAHILFGEAKPFSFGDIWETYFEETYHG